MSVRFSAEEFQKLKQLLIVYDWGLRTLVTKLEIIHEDFKTFSESSPIEHIHGRLKAPESIAQKLHRLNLDITAENAEAHLRDIAGVRITCPFARDITRLVDLLRAMPTINILEEKDYINHPKPSGYRSYHVIIEVPIFCFSKMEQVVVEVQIRTEGMNFWATLEHKARYKYEEHIPSHLCDELVLCADKIAELDRRMFLIHESIHVDE